MVAALGLRWLLTAVFAAASVGSLPVFWRVRPARAADRVSDVFHVLMGAALIVMVWRPEPAPAAWLQVIVFGCAAVWFALARPGATARLGPVSLPGAHHALMAGAMIWMITAMQAAMPMAGPGHASDPMPPTPAPVVPAMSHAAMPATPDPARPMMSHATVPAMSDPAMSAMSHAAVPATVLAVGVLLAAYFALAAIPWLVRAIGPGPRINDRAAAGHAAMSAGMAAMLVAML